LQIYSALPVESQTKIKLEILAQKTL